MQNVHNLRVKSINKNIFENFFPLLIRTKQKLIKRRKKNAFKLRDIKKNSAIFFTNDTLS